MVVAKSDQKIVFHAESLEELENLLSALRPLTNPMFPVPCVVGTENGTFRVNSLKGFTVSIWLEDVEEIEK